MPLTERFFIPAEWIDANNKTFIIPPSPLMRQMTSVLRMKSGDKLILCPNNGTELHCHLTEVSNGGLIGKVDQLLTTDYLLLTNLTLAAAITKRDTYEWMLQKCTELGAARFIPLHTERTIKKTPEIPDRWHDITREAAEQSGRVTLPVIETPQTLKQAIASTTGSHQIALHESALHQWPEPSTFHSLLSTIFVGPEGGFSPTEIALFEASNIPVVQLGHLVLRAETAAIAALAKIMLND